MYAMVLKRVHSRCLGVSPFSFRRMLCAGFEDVCVKLLIAKSKTNGPVLGFEGVKDKKTLSKYVAFLGDIMTLSSFLRCLYFEYHLLDDADVDDIAAGCPGSKHSLSMEDSSEAASKAQLMGSIVFRARTAAASVLPEIILDPESSSSKRRTTTMPAMPNLPMRYKALFYRKY
jgi:hypothetical protein